jgi:hypothetical protein
MQSPLFSKLPGEVRHEIFAYALTDYEDTTDLYSRDTYYRRPGYDAPRRTATQLLRTCKRILHEAWFMPFANAEHSFYLMRPSRAPARYITRPKMQQYLDILHQSQGEQTKIERVRVFAQLWALEDGDQLSEVLGMRYFHPKSITITIRYTDTWFWEENQPLRIAARFVDRCRFPDSVIRISMDFESVRRREDEVAFIASQAAEKWYFRRQDGTVFVAKRSETSTAQWTGSSTWEGRRWIRDESRPNEIDYHVMTVTWRPIAPDRDTEEARRLPPADYVSPELRIPITVAQAPIPDRHFSSIAVSELRKASVPANASADDACGAVQAYRDQQSRQLPRMSPVPYVTRAW